MGELDLSVERRWVELARGGDEDAFAALVRQHLDRLYLVALRMTGDQRDAEDAVQEALIQAWQHLPRFREDARFSTWVTRIVVNRCHNLRRAARATVPLPEEDSVPTGGLPVTPAVDGGVVAAAQWDAVRAAVLSLPFHQRAPLVLSTFGGHTHAETGRILGISETAAKVRVHRARRAVLDHLREWR